jgi:hypothetical protein
LAKIAVKAANTADSDAHGNQPDMAISSVTPFRRPR